MAIYIESSTEIVIHWKEKNKVQSKVEMKIQSVVAEIHIQQKLYFGLC
jgi:hypothetical protein